ncbi:hypothetical protein LAJ19_18225 (plasmid) [Deinococcus taeanensis]|uniref:alpha-amylase family glycosyl hydrolase n=1 Tax=Deinococcus taeanensis TaxID=2737050 RepID=UPI001CDCC2A0|nr:alpha-amylase family glycosyl hydrolase [Deinococcus taeanensis]UBV45062.1 hypothetical protein LAJ19_18225 [Deinococcus taeanensis]
MWLQPLYSSPRPDNGYNLTNSCAGGPALGTLDEFRALIGGAVHLSERVRLDLALNPTSDPHPWFQSARADPHPLHLQRSPVTGPGPGGPARPTVPLPPCS